MKLAAQYNRASIIISFSILFIAALVYFVAISYFSNNQIDRDLAEEIDEVSVYVGSHQRLPKPYEFDDNQAVFIPIGHRSIPLRYTDTPFYIPKTNKTESGRAAIGTVQLKGTNYEVIITESKESTEYLIQIIGTITIILSVLLLLALFFTNRYVLSGLWRPFYQLLDQLKVFDVSKTDRYNTNSTKVDEFRELYTTIDLMAERARNDYQSLKMFTENASHEMMTPIAVITSKLDNMIQDDTLGADQYEQLQDIYSASNKLSRLNQSLLLLVKIDNHLIHDAVEINVKTLLEEKLNQFQEIIKSKGLLVSDLLHNCTILSNSYLIDILLNNLLSNAIRHNVNGGQLRIELKSNRLIIANTGCPEPLDTSLIFERFQKSRVSEGLGLGLTIARNICENYKFRLLYRFENNFHQFIVEF